MAQRPADSPGPSRSKALAAVTLTSLAATVPLALTGTHASANALVTAHARANVLDALRTKDLRAVLAADPSTDDAHLAIDGRDDTAWTGRAGESQWKWVATFAHPVHLGLVRAHFGASPTSGVPVVFHWEIQSPRSSPSSTGETCVVSPGDDDWSALPDTDQEAVAPPPTPSPAEMLAQPTRRSWFVDVDACALRLVVDRTNAGPPVVREVQAIESARDVLRGGEARDDGEYPGFDASGAVDGTYGRRWAGEPRKNGGTARWSLRVDLPDAEPIDRVRLVLGFDATSVPRPGSGRSYAIAWGPVHYVLEGSDDGKRFFPLATEPTRADGTVLPLRRRLVTFSEPHTLRALRLVMTGATGPGGVPEADAVPVVREIAAYRSDDPRPILAAPWVLSVNANPSAESHTTPGGELTNDAYWTKFLQRRFSLVVPGMRRDDRYDRSLGGHGEPLDAPPHDEAGEVLEAIEGDDPLLDAQFLSQSSPPPITVLSGSDDWDYAPQTGPDAKRPREWYWDPLPGALHGGIGQLAPAVRQRVAPFLGFCGGAQLLALLESTQASGTGSAVGMSADDDRRAIDQVLRRTSGHPIRGFAPPIDFERAWPGDPPRPRAVIQFLPNDPLFADAAGSLHRSTTQALPESHSDAVRADAFLPGGPLERFEVVATSAFCAPDVVAASPRDGVFPNPSGAGWCDTVPEAFRSRDPAWPIVGMQFHAEQRDFTTPGPGDPPESIADARLVFSAAYEGMIDAYVKLAP